jgi:hypothetical protein
VTNRDTVDGYIEALLEAHTEGLHDDVPEQSCPDCQDEVKSERSEPDDF